MTGFLTVLVMCTDGPETITTQQLESGSGTNHPSTRCILLHRTPR